MSNLKVKIKTDEFDDSIKTKLVGGRWWAIVVILILIDLNLSGIYSDLHQANKLKEEDIKIRREQLELSCRQLAMDSMALEQNRKIR